MRRPMRTPLMIAGAAMLLAACAETPVAPTAPAPPRFTSGPSVTLWGPDAIFTSGNYTYDASTTAIIEPSFQWSMRTCPTADVASCTANWAQALPTSADYFTTWVEPNCPGTGEAVKEIRVVVTGWFSVHETATYVTALCPVIDS
jgi:hypothetical protein